MKSIKDEEEWRPIPIVGYEHLYEVSNYGRVRSLDRVLSYKPTIYGNKYTSIYKGRMLIPKLSKTGYLEVSLSKKGTLKSFRIHRLVAKAFIPNVNNYKVINHINEVKTDNRVENLEWCTIKYNTETYYSKRIVIYQYDLNGNFIKTWNSITKAAKHYGIDKTGIHYCCIGKLKTYYNFIWTYSELSNSEYKRRITNVNKKKVILLDFNNVIIKEFNSMIEASKYANCNPSFISMCCANKRTSKLGIWKKLRV